MSATPLITLGDEFVQTQSAQQARRSRRSQRRAMEALIEQAIAKKARVQVTAAAAEALSASLPVVPTQGMATRMSDDADAVDATPPEKPLLVPAQPAASMRTPAAVPHDIQALGRLKAGQMNQTEAAYAQYLLRQQAAGEIVWHRFEGLTLKLASRATYTPDFVVMRADGQIELHEVKGAKAIFRDDARAKTRIAAGEFPFRVLVVYPRDRAFSGWDIEEF